MIHTASCEHFDGLKFLSFRFFGDLKTPFLPSCVTHGSRDPSFLWALFRHLGASKCYFWKVVDHTIQTYLALCEIIFFISVAQKCFFSRVAEHTVQWYLDSRELIFYSLAFWKSDFWQVLKSTIKLYVASRELIFGILAAWKSLFCEVVKTMVNQQVIFCIWGSKYVA